MVQLQGENVTFSSFYPRPEMFSSYDWIIRVQNIHGMAVMKLHYSKSSNLAEWLFASKNALPKLREPSCPKRPLTPPINLIKNEILIRGGISKFECVKKPLQIATGFETGTPLVGKPSTLTTRYHSSSYLILSF